MNHSARMNRKKKLVRLIQEDIGPDREFTVYDIYRLWGERWSRCPTIKELSKVLPTNPALDRYKVSPQALAVYRWDGKKDLSAFLLETPEQHLEFRKLGRSDEDV